MSQAAFTLGPLSRAAQSIAPYAAFLGLGGMAVLAGAWFTPDPLLQKGLGLGGMTLLFVALLVRLIAARGRRAQERYARTVQSLVENDAAPGFMTDADGALTYCNRAARDRFEGESDTLVALVGDLFAEPQAVLSRLQNKASLSGQAREDVVLKRGHMRITVHAIGHERFLWRLEEMEDRSAGGRNGEGINLPMMTVSTSGTILFMNEPLRRLLGGRQTSLDRIFAELPVRNGEVMQVNCENGSVRSLICKIPSSAGRHEIYLLPEPEGQIIEQADWDLVDALPVPLLKLDAEGRILMANSRARTLLGDDDPVGSQFSDQVEGAGRPLSEWLYDVFSGRPTTHAEVVRALKPENETFFQVSLERVSERDGPVLVAVLQDATELKSMEAQYLQSQKMQAIGQLAGGIAHDFNNLLTAISGYCDLLVMRKSPDDPDYSDLEQIRQNANRAATLVGQLLSFSRKQTLRPEVLDLAETLDDLTHLLNRLLGETVRLELVQDPRLLKIRADKRHLEQVLMNLVVNARDSMPDGGVVRLETRNTILDRPLERDRATVPAGEYVTIKVQDSGIGIPADKLTRIFEPFYTTKKAGQGTGLGLSMAYGIVKQTGGFIFVDSKVGEGTTFTLYFPKAAQQEETQEIPPARDAMSSPPNVLRLQEDIPGKSAVQDEEPEEQAILKAIRKESSLQEVNDAPADAPVATSIQEHQDTREEAEKQEDDLSPAPETPRDSLEGRVVLLVEDEAPVRAFASRALRMRGFTVLEAESAEDALELLKDQMVEVDVFVSDVVMPGMDGPTWVAEALKDRPNVKVIFVSGYAADSVSQHQARIPNSVFLPKPFSLSELTRTVQRQLH